MTEPLELPPGIHYDVSWDGYKSIRLPNQSLVKHMLRSPLRCWRVINGEHVTPESDPIRIGNAVHCSIAAEIERVAVMPEFQLDDENLTTGKTKSPPKKMFKKDGTLSSFGIKWQEFCRENDKPEDYTGEITYDREKTESKSTDYYQAKATEFREVNAGKTILNEVEWNIAKKAIRAIESNGDCNDLIRRSKHEVTVIADIEGVRTKTRLDLLADSEFEVGEIKTSNNIEERAFWRTCSNLNYPFQFAWHRLALRNAPGGFEPQHYSVIAAETQDDFDAALIEVPIALLDNWDSKVLDAIRRFKECRDSAQWPGLYPSGRGQLYIPDWAMLDGEVEYSG